TACGRRSDPRGSLSSCAARRSIERANWASSDLSRKASSADPRIDYTRAFIAPPRRRWETAAGGMAPIGEKSQPMQTKLNAVVAGVVALALLANVASAQADGTCQ